MAGSPELEFRQDQELSIDVDSVLESNGLGEYVLERDDHLNAPGIVIRPDEVQTVLSTIENQAGFDHCSCVTAQEYADRYETIYHLKSYDDPTRELSIIVPTPRDRPVSESAESVYRTADWHEREAYDLVGIEYEDHPDLRRILLPETWQGHPLSRDYDQDQSQIYPLRTCQPDRRRRPRY